MQANLYHAHFQNIHILFYEYIKWKKIFEIKSML